MAFQLLAVVDAVKAGTGTLDLATAGVSWDETTYTEGLEFANDGKTFLFVKNTTGSLVTIGIDWIPVNDPDGRQAPDDALGPDVLEGDEGIMGPYLPRIWNSVLGRIQFFPDNIANEPAILYVAIRIDNPT